MSAAGRGKVREANDYYPTPYWLIAAILPLLRYRLAQLGVDRPRVYEPAAGHALAIVNALVRAWPDAVVDYSDIVKEHGSVDFLVEPPEPVYDLIITNPPYSLAQEFCDRAKLWRRTERSLIVMLLRINFLGSKKRAAWMRQNLPSLAVSPRRPMFALNQHGKRGTDATEYAWFIWPYDYPYLSILETEGGNK